VTDKPVLTGGGMPSFLGKPQTTRTSLLDLAFRRFRKENTRRAYLGAWSRFAAFHGYETPGPLLARLAHESKADAVAMVHEWRDDMDSEGKRPNTIAQGLRAVSSVIDNLHRAEAFPYTIKGLVEAPTPNRYTDVTGVSHEAWKAMLEAVSVDDEPNNVRDRALLLCLHDVMLRRSEASKLDVTDWHPFASRHGELEILGKGRDDRERMPVTWRTHEAIDRWLAVRAAGVPAMEATRGPLFTHLPLKRKSAPRRLTSDGVVHSVRRVAEAAGVTEPVSPHRLRHAGGTYLARQNVPPDVLMHLMRHKSMETTMVYVRRANPEYADALQRMEDD